MPSFGKLARHYDRLMHNVPYAMWASYYQLILASIEHDPDSVLDVCCGTGTVAEIMSQNGFHAAGVDLSPEMIREARRKAIEKDLEIDYFVADVTTMELGKQFDSAYSFFDSLNYITTPEGLHAAVQRTAAHLNRGGSFVFDLNTEFAFQEQMFDQREVHPNRRLRYEWTGTYDPESRLICVRMEFWTKEGEQFVEEHHQRAHPHDEVLTALRDAGFRHISAFDAYTMNPPRARSDRLHYVAWGLGE
ncbi:MAG: class I SAM-dependent methyltransferase [Fimbriimonadaceae bacterium]|nr:class I SAM-dependent methyltransferase [Fimbriimonadaceae bacterium]